MSSINNLIIKSGPPVKVLVIGGSYGGLSAALNLWDLCTGKEARFKSHAERFKPSVDDSGAKQYPLVSVEISIVDERDGFYHLIGSPLAFASKDYASKAWTKFEGIPALQAPEISYTQGSVTNLDCDQKIAMIKEFESGNKVEMKYDYVVASSGLRRVWPVVPQALTKDGYLSEMNDHIDKVVAAPEGVIVVGGGAVGVEMAAEIKLREPQQKVTLIQSREKLLSSEPLPDEFKNRALEVLRATGVEVILGNRVIKSESIQTPNKAPLIKLTMGDGSEIMTSFVIRAASQSVPITSYLPKEVLNPNGYVQITSTLNLTEDIPNSQQHFAIGDIAAWSGIKRSGGALYMGFAAATNIYQQMLQKEFAHSAKLYEIPEFDPRMALAVGRKAVLHTPEHGTTWGDAEMELMFGDDLGYQISCNHLGLGLGNDGSDAPVKGIDG